MTDQRTALSRREREIVEILYALEAASVQDVRSAMTSPPSYSAVRATLRILEEKGHVTHRQEGPAYVYSPAVPKSRARRAALRRLVTTFFDGSPAAAAATLIDQEARRLSSDELDRLEALIQRAREEDR